MKRYKKIQEELIEQAINKGKLDIIQKDISYNKIKGTIYYKNNTKPKKSILLVHGWSGNRYGLGVLAEILAEAGFFCLSIDLPSHYLNLNKFSLGEVGETVTDAVLLLKQVFKMKSIGLIGHSLGAIACLLSSLGYTKKIEEKIYTVWNNIILLMEKEGYLIEKGVINTEELNHIHYLIEREYIKIKQLILNSLKKTSKTRFYVHSLILLSMPRELKKTYPGIRILKGLKEKHLKKVITNFFHKPNIKQGLKKGDPLKYLPENEEQVNWQCFRTKEIHELFNYILNLKEAPNFLKLIQDIIKFKHKEGRANLIEYYYKNYLLKKPKLILYGWLDLLLKPFMPLENRRLKSFYNSLIYPEIGEIHHGMFNHLILNNKNPFALAAVAVKDKKVIKRILKFLYRY